MSQVPVDPGSPEEGGCDEVRRHLWSYLDTDIDPPSSAELEAHLEGCASCRRMVEFDQRFKQLVRRCRDAEPISPAVVETLRSRVEAVIRVRRLSSAEPVSPSAAEASRIEGTPPPRQHWAGAGRQILGFVRWPVLLMWSLIHALRYSSALAERLVHRAVGLLPESTREQYGAEWLAELDWLKQQRRPLVG